jgi:MYXO-CTERM domain-containing protein
VKTLAAVVAWLVLAPATAWANGQTTHVWITIQALELLEPGPVRDLLLQPGNRDPLLNGAMFPDGGYAAGDDYGEQAHWEPFQQEYLAWIRETYAPPFDEGDAAQHVAFLMGMGSHGMADEVFDSLFMERSRAYDPAWGDPETASLDTASDVLLADQVGGLVPPISWLPAEVLAGIFVDRIGYSVDVETLERGHQLLFVALGGVDALRFNEERLTTFGAGYPWTNQHLLDESIPGSPLHEASVIAAYWEDLWRRLHGEPWVGPVLDFVPGDGSWSHEVDSSLVEARLALNFARGIRSDTLDAVHVEDSSGAVVDAEIGLFYGDRSHAVLVRPDADWTDATDYRVFVSEGLMDHDGSAFEGSWSAAFSTADPPAEVDDPAGCACETSGAGHGSWGLFGLLLVARRRP